MTCIGEYVGRISVFYRHVGMNERHMQGKYKARKAYATHA